MIDAYCAGPIAGHRVKAHQQAIGGFEQWIVVEQTLAVNPILPVRMFDQELHIANQMSQAELQRHIEVVHVFVIGAEIVATPRDAATGSVAGVPESPPPSPPQEATMTAIITRAESPANRVVIVCCIFIICTSPSECSIPWKEFIYLYLTACRRKCQDRPNKGTQPGRGRMAFTKT